HADAHPRARLPHLIFPLPLIVSGTRYLSRVTYMRFSSPIDEFFPVEVSHHGLRASAPRRGPEPPIAQRKGGGCGRRRLGKLPATGLLRLRDRRRRGRPRADR